MNHDCFGFLGVTLLRYANSKFFQLKTLQIGILKIEGSIDQDRYFDFIYNSTNKILKSNDKIILLKDKTKFKLTHTKEDSDSRDSDDSDDSCSFSSSVNASLNFENCKFDILTNFLSDFEKGITNIRLKNILQFSLVNVNLQPKILESIPEYHELEKKKILTVFKIFNSFRDYNLEIPNKLNNTKLNFNILKLSDAFLQKIILEIFLLFILGIFNIDLTFHSINFILNIDKDITDNNRFSDNLRLILACEVVYLLGFYYDMYLHLTQKLSHEKDNDIDFNQIFQHVNKLSSRNIANSNFFSKSEENSIISRKNFINLNFIVFFENELQTFEKIVTITQHIHDFLINKKIDKYLIKNSLYYYRIFLEIRSYFFEHINKSDIEEGVGGAIFNGHTDKEYYNYRIKKLDYDCYFKDTKEKQSSLLYKDKKGKINIKYELKKGVNKITLPKMDQIKKKLTKFRSPHWGKNITQITQINSPSNTNHQTQNNSQNISICQSSPNINLQVNLKQHRVRNNRAIDIENFNALKSVKSSSNINISTKKDSSKFFAFNSVFKKSDSLLQIKDKINESKKLYSNFKKSVPLNKHNYIYKRDNLYLTNNQDTNNTHLTNSSQSDNEILTHKTNIEISFKKKLKVRKDRNNTINTIFLNKEIVLPSLSKRSLVDEVEKQSFKYQHGSSSKANLLRNASYLKTDHDMYNSNLFITPLEGFLK